VSTTTNNTINPGTTAGTGSLNRTLAKVAAGAALAFAAGVAIAGALDPGYSHRSEAMSALASTESESAAVMIVAFLFLSLTALASGAVLARVLRGKAARAGSTLVLVAGAATVVVGFARQSCSSLQEACLARESAGEVSGAHVVHNLVSLLLFVCLVIGGFLLASGLRRNPAYAHLARRTRIAASASLVLMVWFGSAAYGDNGGIVQRLFLLLAFGIPVVLALRVSKR
jgi:hypothetical membrane protein